VCDIYTASPRDKFQSDIIRDGTHLGLDAPPEVRKLHLPGAVDEEVLRLQVAVQDASGVKVLERGPQRGPAAALPPFPPQRAQTNDSSTTWLKMNVNRTEARHTSPCSDLTFWGKYNWPRNTLGWYVLSVLYSGFFLCARLVQQPAVV
jgi:hypothetical protein